MREVVALEGLSREDWLAEKRKGVGGGDIGPILGLSPYAGPLDVYAEKVTTESRPETSLMRMGQAFEDGIAAIYAQDTGSNVEKPTHMYGHDTDLWRLANFDRFTDNDGLGVLECKMSSRPSDWESGPPEGYELQCHWYLGVTGLDYADLAALVGGRELLIYRIERDDVLLDNLVSVAGEFWQRVLDRRPPPPDERSGNALKMLYKGGADTIDLPAEMAVTVAALRDAIDARKKAEAVEEGYKNDLRAMMGDHEVATIGGRRVASWRTVVPSKVDLAALEIDHPDLVSKYRRGVPYRRFQLTKQK